MGKTKSIAKQITQAREALGLSKRELADIMGKAPNVISRYEAGKLRPGARLLAQFADALKEDFITYSKTKKREL